MLGLSHALAQTYQAFLGIDIHFRAYLSPVLSTENTNGFEEGFNRIRKRLIDAQTAVSNINRKEEKAARKWMTDRGLEYKSRKKLQNLNAQTPEVIVTSNIGCLIHLNKNSKIPVKHWIELFN